MRLLLKYITIYVAILGMVACSLSLDLEYQGDSSSSMRDIKNISSDSTVSNLEISDMTTNDMYVPFSYDQLDCGARCELEWIYISNTQFIMGNEDGDLDEVPLTMINVQSFETSRAEVTVGQYSRCVRAGVCPPPIKLERSEESLLDMGYSVDFGSLDDMMMINNIRDDMSLLVSDMQLIDPLVPDMTMDKNKTIQLDMSSNEIINPLFQNFDFLIESNQDSFVDLELVDTGISDMTLNPIETNLTCHWFLDGKLDYPMNCITQCEAQIFAQWAGGRLLSEVEWESLATHGGTTQYPWGDSDAVCTQAFTNECIIDPQEDYTHALCQRMDTTKETCNLLGNIAEWVGDRYHDNYLFRPTTSATWERIAIEECSNNLLGITRGGSFKDLRDTLRVSDRTAVSSTTRAYHIGFRVAK
jgi:formylglycine-generating enzyme required for sulfatase activity